MKNLKIGNVVLDKNISKAERVRQKIILYWFIVVTVIPICLSLIYIYLVPIFKSFLTNDFWIMIALSELIILVFLIIYILLKKHLNTKKNI